MATFKVALLALFLAFSATFLSVFSTSSPESHQQDWLKEAVSEVESSAAYSSSETVESNPQNLPNSSSSWDGKTLSPSIVRRILFHSAYFMKVHVAALKWDSSELYRTVIRDDDKSRTKASVVQLNLNYYLMAKMLRNGAHLG
ncbi:hypothetical protein TYRP_009513 [Tyrophagus putrescentiae]|nr:hypothetical protein TYRP_009513 [Tyrophagus putrescentiae]